MIHYFTKLLLIVLFSSFTVKSHSKEITLRLEPQITLNTYQGLVEEHLSSVLRTLKTIAISSEAKSGDWRTIKPLLEQFSNELQTKATLWFALPDGSYFSTDVGRMVEQNLKDRAYFSRLMSGENILGDLVISKSTGHRSVIIATPVIVKGKSIAALGVSLSVRLLSELIQSHMKLPEGTYFYSLTSELKIPLHKYADRMFKSVSEVGDESLGEDFKTILSEDHGTFNYILKGKNITSIFQKSHLLGWYFLIAQVK